jgi:peptide deformylase
MEIVVPDEFKYLYVRNEQRPVYKIPDDVLRQNTTPIAKVNKKTQALIDSMMRIMKNANGVGLAAPQVGVLQQIIVIAPEGSRPMALVNPVITKREGSVVGSEGCLSLPGLYGDVVRAEYIEVRALDRKGKTFVYEMEGMPARVVQHEIDHLTGVLFIDKVDPISLHWQHPNGGPDEI